MIFTSNNLKLGAIIPQIHPICQVLYTQVIKAYDIDLDLCIAQNLLYGCVIVLTLILPTVAKSIFAYCPQTVQPLFEK